MGSRFRGKGLKGKEFILRGWIVPVGGATPDRRVPTPERWDEHLKYAIIPGMNSRVRHKALLLERSAELHEATSPAAFNKALRGLCADNAILRAPHPLPNFRGVRDIASGFWKPLRRAFPDIERRFDILVSARIAGREWTCATGHFVGTFARDFLGIPATGGAAFLRCAEFRRVAPDGRAREVVLFLDFPDLMLQANAWPLPPSLGAEMMFPAPATRDGVVLHSPDENESQKTSALVRAMLDGLSRYRGDLQSLKSMNQKRFWHPKMMWHGPAGIGTNPRPARL